MAIHRCIRPSPFRARRRPPPSSSGIGRLSDTIANDWQEVQIQNSSGATLAQVMRVCANTRAWTHVVYDLSAYKGQTIRVYFNVHGNGNGNLTYMYLDDVNLGVK